MKSPTSKNVKIYRSPSLSVLQRKVQPLRRVLTRLRDTVVLECVATLE